ncbi:hypothetical protein RFI_31591, partial [Reticulomyxa filosa]
MSIYDKKSEIKRFEVEFICVLENRGRKKEILYKEKCKGGMQDSSGDNININAIHEGDKKYEKEIKTLTQLLSDSINKEELKKKIMKNNGNIELVIKDIVQQFIENEVYYNNKNISYFITIDDKSKINELEKIEQKQEQEQKQENTMNILDNNNKSIQKEMEKSKIGETKPGINLQGYCINEICLASKAKLPVWINIGFNNITFISDKTSFNCPHCKKETVTSIVKAIGDPMPVKDNNYQCSYSIKSGLPYELKANKIKQHAKSIEDLRERSEHAMNSIEIKNLVIELQKYEITVVKSPSLKGSEKLFEKIQANYGGDFNQAFDIGRFTILCDNSTKLQTAVAVIKKAEQFNLIVAEDKDFFVKNLKHIIVFIILNSTLKKFTTLEGYAIIENPKLSHLFYEQIRAWKPNNQIEEELKQASDETLAKINDIICEWIDEKEIKKI